jgi:hypothetical protein
MVLELLIVIGVLLVVVGVILLFKLKGHDSDTTFGIGSVKITTKSPALAVMVIGILCVSARFVVPGQGGTPSQRTVPNISELPEDVMTDYLDLVAAYNARDSATYYGHFAEPMECFYSKANTRIDANRTELNSYLQVVQSDLAPLDVRPERVELCDRGRWGSMGKLTQHHKIIVMKKLGRTWRVVIETSADQNRCYSSPYAEKC